MFHGSLVSFSPGFFSASGAVNCQPCRPGFISAAGAAVCTPCAEVRIVPFCSAGVSLQEFPERHACLCSVLFCSVLAGLRAEALERVIVRPVPAWHVQQPRERNGLQTGKLHFAHTTLRTLGDVLCAASLTLTMVCFCSALLASWQALPPALPACPAAR